MRPSRILTVAVVPALFAAAVAVARQDPPAGPRPSPESNPTGPAVAGGTGTPRGADVGPVTPSTPAVKAVQDMLGRTVTAAVTPHKAADLLTLVATRDRDRIKIDPAAWADVDRAADAFQSAWATRFGTSFKLDDKVPIAFTEPTMHIAGLPGTAGAPASAPAGADSGREATVVLTDPSRRSAVLLHLSREGDQPDGWRLNLADGVTAATLHDSLLRHLTAVTDNQKRWPTDADQAYVYATQKVLSALGEPSTPR